MRLGSVGDGATREQVAFVLVGATVAGGDPDGAVSVADLAEVRRRRAPFGA